MSANGREPDPAEIGAFVDALFRYADDGTYVSLRAFHQFDCGKPPVLIRGVRLNGGGLETITQAAFAAACDAANAAEPTVFAPPIATFIGPNKASEIELANCIAISVEIDGGNIAKALATLESLLGPATVVVASGGDYTDPQTGEVQAKLHVHFRLSEPTRDPTEHARLKHARRLACDLVGADPTAKSSAHPLRWAGSWHLKATPRLATIVALNPGAEVHLSQAIDALEMAVEAAGLREAGNAADSAPKASGEPQAPLAWIVSALASIPNGTGGDHWDDWIRIGLLTYRSTAGSAEGLKAWRTWSSKSVKHTDESCDERWIHFNKSPPTRGGAGTIFWLAKRYGWARPQPEALKPPPEPEDQGYQGSTSADGAALRNRGADIWPQPLDFLADQDGEPPALEARHLPAALFDFVLDTAERMGVDPVSVALAAIVSCASVASDEWRVQPKRFDYTWTENPRLWGAIVGIPSIMKSPIIRACTQPIDVLDATARQRYADEMRAYRAALKKAKADKSGDIPDPGHPRLERYLIEDTTVEAISEVLREDEGATQCAPARKVLCRHDEMSEFFANLDRYKAGGKGSDRGAYLRLYNGGSYTYDRIGRGSFSIPNWSAGYIGGIQPEPIQKIAKDAAEDGMLQRFLYSVPGPQRPGVDRVPSTAALKRYRALFPVLTALHPPQSFDDEHQQTVKLHENAHQHRDAIDTLARVMSLLPDTSGRLKAALGKWPGLFARVALTFHLIEIADARANGAIAPVLTLIAEETARRAATFMREVATPHLLRAHALMFSTTQTGHARWIARYILARGLDRITSRDVVRAYGALRSPEAKDELTAVMTSLVTVSWLEPEAPSNPLKPVNSWQVNPAVHAMFASEAEQERERRERTREDIVAHERRRATGT